MPRATQSREGGIVNYFKTADLAIAQVVLGLAGDAVKERKALSAAARERSLQALKKATPAPAATPAKVKPAAAAAAPKAKAKPKAKKRARPSRAKAKPSVSGNAIEEVFDLPDAAFKD